MVGGLADGKRFNAGGAAVVRGAVPHLSKYDLAAMDAEIRAALGEIGGAG
jgi:hypothetical protein